MKTISGRVANLAARYSDNAPAAAICCNACRSCIWTNLATIALALLAASGMIFVRAWQRVRR